MITIRQAYLADIDRIMPLYERAKRYMQLSGNPNQWIDGYPARNDIKADIEAHHCFVVCDDVEILAAFAYIEGHDPPTTISMGHGSTTSPMRWCIAWLHRESEKP